MYFYLLKGGPAERCTGPWLILNILCNRASQITSSSPDLERYQPPHSFQSFNFCGWKKYRILSWGGGGPKLLKNCHMIFERSLTHRWPHRDPCNGCQKFLLVCWQPRYLVLIYRHIRGHGKPIRSLYTSGDTGSNIRYLLVTSLKCWSFFRLDFHQALHDP